jgi:integrase
MGQVQEEQKGGEMASRECPNCKSKKNWKDGVRETAFGSIQRFICRECGFRFSDSKGLNLDSDSYGVSQLCAKIEAKKLDITTETKTVVGKSEKLIDFAWKLKKRNLCDQTIALRTYYLNKLLEYGANLNDPDSVETILATEKFTPSQKLHSVTSYRSYTKTFKIAWEPIKVKYQPKEPYMPTNEDMNALINGSGKSTATFLQVAIDTGARRGEICKLKWTDVNFENKTISINEAEKNSRNRTLKVHDKTIAMIQRMSKKYTPYIFNPNPNVIKKSFQSARYKLSIVQQNPRLMQIHLHTFRHVYASNLLRKTLTLKIVQDALGHKSIVNTERYTKTVVLKEEEYYTAIAKTVDESRKLLEDNWTYILEMDGVRIFRKAK